MAKITDLPNETLAMIFTFMYLQARFGSPKHGSGAPGVAPRLYDAEMHTDDGDVSSTVSSPPTIEYSKSDRADAESDARDGSEVAESDEASSATSDVVLVHTGDVDHGEDVHGFDPSEDGDDSDDDDFHPSEDGDDDDDSDPSEDGDDDDGFDASEDGEDDDGFDASEDGEDDDGFDAPEDGEDDDGFDASQDGEDDDGFDASQDGEDDDSGWDASPSHHNQAQDEDSDFDGPGSRNILDPNTWADSQDGQTPFVDTSFPYSVAGVCQRWLQNLIRHPEYWTLLLAASDMPWFEPDMQSQLEWSRDLPFSLAIQRHRRPTKHCKLPKPEALSLQRQKVTRIMASFVPHFHRCTSLFIDVSATSALPCLVKELHKDGPKLRALRLQCDIDDGGNTDFLRRFPKPVDETQPFCESLKRASLDGRNFLAAAFHRPEWYIGLSSLTIDQFGDDIGVQRLPVTVLMSLLNDIVRLENLCLKNIHLSEISGDNQLSLRLESLEKLRLVHVTPVEAIHCLLRGVTYPSLDHLSITHPHIYTGSQRARLPDMPVFIPCRIPRSHVHSAHRHFGL
ncbi:hypothetical protein HGRIS_008773 [Hohenbuehelia grisea]|uniref:Uncharacterized protein n=1 Tax=Hohenbuehelia grisea TaxID=104357 RepID=A0ABR3J9J5_9AGAR